MRLFFLQNLRKIKGRRTNYTAKELTFFVVHIHKMPTRLIFGYVHENYEVMKSRLLKAEVGTVASAGILLINFTLQR